MANGENEERLQQLLSNVDSLREFQGLEPDVQTRILEGLSPEFQGSGADVRQSILTGINEQPAERTLGSALRGAPGNIIPSAIEFGRDVLQAVNDPKTTFDSLTSVMLGALEKLVPGEQISRDTKSIEATTDFFKNRFGSVQNALKTLEEDPFGLAADVGSLFSVAGTPFRATSVAGRIARTGARIDPVTGIGTGISKLAAEGTPQRAINNIKKAIQPGTSPRLSEPVRLAREDLLGSEFLQIAKNDYIEGGLKFNRKSVQKLQDGITSVQDDIKEILDRETLKGKTIAKEDVIKSLDDLVLSKKDIAFAESAEDIVRENRVITRYIEGLRADPDKFLTPNQLQEFKKLANKSFKANVTQGVDSIRKVARDELRSAAKAILDENFPELRELNATQGVMIELEDALAGAIRKFERTDKTFGGGIVSMVRDILNQPKVRIARAKATNFANKALRVPGRVGTATRPLFQIGRLQEEIQNQ